MSYATINAAELTAATAAVGAATAAGALTLAQNLQLTVRRLLFAYDGGAVALAMDLVLRRASRRLVAWQDRIA